MLGGDPPVAGRVRHFLIEGGETIHNEDDTRWYMGPTIDLQKRVGIPRAVFVIGALVNARKVKGLEPLIRAASLLGEKSRRRAIVIMGRGKLSS